MPVILDSDTYAFKDFSALTVLFTLPCMPRECVKIQDFDQVMYMTVRENFLVYRELLAVQVHVGPVSY